MAFTFKKDSDGTYKESLKPWLTEVVSSALENGPLALKAKWDQREAVYLCDKAYAGAKLFDNVEPYPYDVLGPVVRQIIDTLMSSFTLSEIYVQAIPVASTSQEAADVLETGVQQIVDSAEVERTLWMVLFNALICGVGFIRPRMTKEGFKLDRIHPNDMVVSVTKGRKFKDANLVGHRFYVPYWDFSERVEAGKYPYVKKDDDLKRFIGVQSNTDGSGVSSSSNPTTNTVDTANLEFEDVRLYELLIRANVEGSDAVWHRVVWSEEAAEVILFEEFPYDDHWYLDVRFHDEEVFWPEQSIVGRILPQCIQTSSLFNLGVVGEMASVSRPMLGSGVLTRKITNVKLGQLIPAQMNGKIEPFPWDFDADKLLNWIEQMLNSINRSAGVSENALSSENFKAETATEVAELAENKQKSEGAKAKYVGDFVEELAKRVHQFCIWHKEIVRKVYGSGIDEKFWLALRAKVKWRMTGRAPGESGAVLVAKNEQLLNLTADPDSPYHRGRAIEAVGDSLGIPNIEKTKKTPEEKQAEKADRKALAQQQAMAEAQEGQAQSPGVS